MEFKTNLHIAFCNIKGSDTGMCNAASNSTTEHTLGIIESVVRDRTDEPN